MKNKIRYSRACAGIVLLFTALSLSAQDTIRVDVNGQRVHTQIIQPTVIRDTVIIRDTVYVTDPGEPPIDPVQRFEAEDFVDMQGVEKEGTVVGFINPGDWIKYSNAKVGKSLKFRYSLASQEAGRKMQIRRDSPTGAIIGEWTHDNTGGWDAWKEATIQITAQYTGDVYLTFSGPDGWVCNLDWLEFGDNSPPEPEPEPEPDPDFELTVASNGNNSTCKPCQTITRALQVAATMPGKVDIKIGPGLYHEPALNIPANVGVIEGAGRDATVIKGTKDLYSYTRRSFMEGFLVNLKSVVDEGINLTIRSLTLDGNKKEGGNNQSVKGGILINKRENVTIQDVEVRQFNTSGLRMYQVDRATFIDLTLNEASGVASTFTYYLLETGDIGGKTILPEGQHNIVFKNLKIISPSLGGGAGWGVIYGGPNSYITNVLLDNPDFYVNPATQDADGHHFDIELIYTNLGNVTVQNGHFRSNISFATDGEALGWTRFLNNRIELPSSGRTAPSIIFEMQISNFEAAGNHITGARNGGFVSSNTMETWGNDNCCGNTFRKPMKNWFIHDNIIETRKEPNSFATGFVGGPRWPVDNIRYINNRHISTIDHGVHWYGLVTDDTDTATGIEISGNTFEGTWPSGSQLFDTAGPISGGVANGNKSTGNFNVTKPRAGVTITP